MKLVFSEKIAKIDSFAEKKLGIPKRMLMHRSGKALAQVVKERLGRGSYVVVLAGAGNNGGDGYAMAYELSAEYRVLVIDVFGKGQRSTEGNYFLEAAKGAGVRVVPYGAEEGVHTELLRADAIVDCILGVGAKKPYSPELREIASYITESNAPLKLAADVPLGVDPDTGEVDEITPYFDVTVSLSFPKVGVVSMPAREYLGMPVFAPLELPQEQILSFIPADAELIDDGFVRENIPKRDINTNKSDFGRLLLLTGSEQYRGAAALALGAALRGGAGYTELMAERTVCDMLLPSFPEAIFIERKPFAELRERDIYEICKRDSLASATLVGSGAGLSDGLCELVLALLTKEGGPLIIDADGCNALSELLSEGRVDPRQVKRKVILTPHPGEFSRLTGIPVQDIVAKRLPLALEFEKRHGVTLVLKGNGTLIAGNGKLYVNSTGSSGLAKAGSGDCLAGFIASLVASAKGEGDIASLSAIGVYLHGKAGDSLEAKYSAYGVRPSDLPGEMARQLADILIR